MEQLGRESLEGEVRSYNTFIIRPAKKAGERGTNRE
jgi:hypothetical protein